MIKERVPERIRRKEEDLYCSDYRLAFSERIEHLLATGPLFAGQPCAVRAPAYRRRPEAKVARPA